MTVKANGLQTSLMVFGNELYECTPLPPIDPRPLLRIYISNLGPGPL
jgi:hypothetical protein